MNIVGLQNIDVSLRTQLRISPTVEGVLVSKIEPSSRGAQLGILKGDILLNLDSEDEGEL